MPAPVTFGNVIGGVNYAYPPQSLPPFYVADAQNILSILSGFATPRKGSSALNSTAYGTLITSFHELILNSTSYKFAAQGTVIGKYNGTNFADHKTGLTTGKYGQWKNYGGYAIYVNGTDNPQKTDGTTINDLTADAGALTGGSCIEEWGERIWIPVGNTLYGSVLRDPTDYSTTTTDSGYYSGTVGDSGQPITGLRSFYDILLIGKLNQIYQLTGAPETASSTFRLTPIQTKDKDSFGFTSKTAIAQVGNDLIFLDGFLIKALSGIQAYGDIGEISIVGNIKDYLIDSSGAGLDKDYLQYSHFFHYKIKEQVYCSIPTGASTRYWFVIDYSNQDLRRKLELPKYSFFPMTGLTPISFGGVENGSQVDIYAGCEDGFVRQLDTGNSDDGTAISSYATWCFGSNNRNIRPIDITLAVRQTTGLTLVPYYAFGLQEWQEIVDATNYTAMDSETVSGSTWILGGNVYQKVLSSFMGESGESFAFKLTHGTANQTYEMRSSQLRYTLQRKYIV